MVKKNGWSRGAHISVNYPQNILWCSNVGQKKSPMYPHILCKISCIYDETDGSHSSKSPNRWQARILEVGEFKNDSEYWERRVQPKEKWYLIINILLQFDESLQVVYAPWNSHGTPEIGLEDDFPRAQKRGTNPINTRSRLNTWFVNWVCPWLRMNKRIKYLGLQYHRIHASYCWLQSYHDTPSCFWLLDGCQENQAGFLAWHRTTCWIFTDLARWHGDLVDHLPRDLQWNPT